MGVPRALWIKRTLMPLTANPFKVAYLGDRYPWEDDAHRMAKTTKPGPRWPPPRDCAPNGRRGRDPDPARPKLGHLGR